MIRGLRAQVVIAVLLALAGCRVEIGVDEERGCVEVDNVQHCADLALDFRPGDRHAVAARPQRDFQFSHWRRGDRHLFGGSSEPRVVMDSAALGEDLPEGQFQLIPQFVPICNTDYSGHSRATHPYIDCYGDELNSFWSFADLSEVDVVHVVSVLFYVDRSIQEIAAGLLSPEELVRRQVTAVNRMLAQSGVHMKFGIAGVIPITLSPMGGVEPTDRVLNDMRDGSGAYRSLLSNKAVYEADLVHSFIHLSAEAEYCGQAYIGVVDALENYQIGVTACHWDAITLAHELGHNLGLDHELTSASDNLATFPFGRAWTRRGANTIMLSSGVSLPYFSSPDLFVTNPLTGSSVQIGSSEVDAVRALNKVRLDYARIRPQVRIAGAALANRQLAPTPVIPPRRH
ncbi:zinc-dependent metalloprotease family protein [Parahaliea aestuarii]|uniref:Peptidase M12B domain-containing protein n=1 Tax=Parahaliea aestuarii TaxID=1852021 RepID=A0A5C8ZKM9_9GAMM|nr:zinc-dependent metalloprotease family protein [Parahaliea aestuarii]TXS89126.1 hypothetical protein FVW59_18560 [Parahaliea aestuarii]